MKRPGIILGCGVVMLAAGLVWAIRPPETPASTMRPAVSASPAPASVSPQVAGESTAAPAPATTPATANSGSAPTARNATQAPAAPAPASRTSSQAPAQQSSAQLVISISGAASTYEVALSGPATACEILKLAKTQGHLKSVTLTYYESFKSYYVAEINGFANNWTFKVNGTAPSVGCSAISVNQGDSVKWSYQ